MTDINLKFSRSDVLSLALTVTSSAWRSRHDERLSTAACEYALAATIWRAAGYDTRAREMLGAEQSCREELRAARVAAGLEEEHA